MKCRRCIAPLVVSGLAAAFFFCDAPPLPPDPSESAAIDQERSLNALTSRGDTLIAGQAMLCTLVVTYPEYMDAYYVDISQSNTTKRIGSGTVTDTIVPVVLSIDDVGSWTLMITVVKADGKELTLDREVVILAEDPARDAGFDKVVSLRQLSERGDSLIAGEVVPCTLLTVFPTYLKNLQVILLNNSNYDVLKADSVVDSLIPLFLSIADTGTYSLRAKVTRTSGGFDSLVHTIRVVPSAKALPATTPDSTVYHVHIGDSVTLGFDFSDEDGSLFASIIHEVTVGGTEKDTAFYLTPVSSTRREWVVTAESYDTVFCLAQAIDDDKQKGAVVKCTVVVIDTVTPQLSLITTLPDTILNLPITIQAHVTDLSGIESVKFGDEVMSLTQDTAEIVVSALDSGETEVRICASDRAGNRDSIGITLRYYGEKTYPPELTISDQSIIEGQEFDTIYLADSVRLTDPSISDTVSFIADSLTWKVVEQPGKLVVDTLMGPPRVVISLPDTVLGSGDLLVEQVTITVTDSRGRADHVTAVFAVSGVNDQPVVTIGNQSKLCGFWFDTLKLGTSFADEEDDSTSAVRWEFEHGKHLRVDSVFTFTKDCSGFGGICVFRKYFTGRIVVVPKSAADSNWTGVDTVSFRVQDTDGAWSDTKKVRFSRSTDCIILPLKKPLDTAWRKEE